jgi:hypothetical protein
MTSEGGGAEKGAVRLAERSKEATPCSPSEGSGKFLIRFGDALHRTTYPINYILLKSMSYDMSSYKYFYFTVDYIET